MLSRSSRRKRGPSLGNVRMLGPWVPVFAGTKSARYCVPFFHESLMPSPRRIDVHFHLIPPFYQEAVYAAGAGPAIGRYPDWSPERALELMDQSGIALALTSLAQPGVQFGDPTKAAALARRCNEYASELGARWPKR